MNLQRTTALPTQTELSTSHGLTQLIQRLSQHVICLALGITGGGIGVALVIGISILIQAFRNPPAAFLPNVNLVTLIAVLVSLAISWLLSLAARRLLPGFRDNFNTLSFQLILISSALTSLLENYLFMHNLTALNIPANTVWVNVIQLLQATV
jgi:hypothetical protein